MRSTPRVEAAVVDEAISADVRRLETLRRELEAARGLAGSILDGIDKGWISGEGIAYQERRRQDCLAQVAVLEPQLRDLVAWHKLNNTGAVDRWVALHLQVCQAMLREAAASEDFKKRVGTVCIGSLLTQLGALLQPGAFTFWVNGSYLTDYEARFDALAAWTPGDPEASAQDA